MTSPFRVQVLQQGQCSLRISRIWLDPQVEINGDGHRDIALNCQIPSCQGLGGLVSPDVISAVDNFRAMVQGGELLTRLPNYRK